MATSPDNAFLFEPTASLPVLTEVYPMVDRASHPPTAAEAESVHLYSDGGTEVVVAEMSAEQRDESLQWLDAQLEQVQTAIAGTLDSAREAAREFINLGAEQGARIQELNAQLAAMNELSNELAASPLRIQPIDATHSASFSAGE